MRKVQRRNDDAVPQRPIYLTIDTQDRLDPAKKMLFCEGILAFAEEIERRSKD